MVLRILRAMYSWAEDTAACWTENLSDSVKLFTLAKVVFELGSPNADKLKSHSLDTKLSVGLRVKYTFDHELRRIDWMEIKLSNISTLILKIRLGHTICENRWRFYTVFCKCWGSQAREALELYALFNGYFLILRQTIQNVYMPQDLK